MWIPLPTTDQFQTVEIKAVNAPGKRTILDEREYGNKVLFLEFGPKDSNKTVELRFQVQRLEKAAYAEDAPCPEKHLNAEHLVPINEDFRSIAGKVVEGKKGSLVRYSLPHTSVSIKCGLRLKKGMRGIYGKQKGLRQICTAKMGNPQRLVLKWLSFLYYLSAVHL